MKGKVLPSARPAVPHRGACPWSLKEKMDRKSTRPFSPLLFWSAHPRGKGHSRFAVRKTRAALTAAVSGREESEYRAISAERYNADYENTKL